MRKSKGQYVINDHIAWKKLDELMKEVGVTREYLLAHMKNNRRSPPRSYGRGKKKKWPLVVSS